MKITYFASALLSLITLVHNTGNIVSISDSLFNAVYIPDEFVEETGNTDDAAEDDEPVTDEGPAADEKPDNNRPTVPRSLSTHTLGSAQKLEGNVVIVSIFADDAYTSWDLNSNRDLMTYNNMHSYMTTATDKIVEWGKEWGREISIIWDWEEHEDLKYTTKFSANFDQATLDSCKSEEYAWDYIERTIDSDALLTKYNSDNILYLMFFDTPQDNKAVTCTRQWYRDMLYPYEICYLFVRDVYYNLNPGVIAHEILHTFGAPDLYGTDKIYGIGQDYADWADRERLNDIMLSIPSGEKYYLTITSDVTEITAYYLGWTDSSETVNKWGFGKSHFS